MVPAVSSDGVGTEPLTPCYSETKLPNSAGEDPAGVEGFEPPNGGIKTRDRNQHNQQVAETADRRVPSSPFDSPSLPPNLPPAIRETAIVPGPGRGTTNYLLLSANLRRPTRHPLTLHRFGRRRISASPRTIRRSRGKSHFVSSVEEGTALGKSSRGQGELSVCDQLLGPLSLRVVGRLPRSSELSQFDGADGQASDNP